MHPDIALTLATGNDAFDFTRGFSDMQITIGIPQAAGAEADRLMNERLFPVATPEIAARITTASDLAEMPLLEVSAHRAGWPRFFDRQGVLPGRARYIFTDNTIMAMALAKEGIGAALARAPASDRAMQEAGLVPCLPDISVPGVEAYHLVYPDRSALRPPARRFRDWLLDHCAGLG